MAKRFTDLNELTSPASDDQLAIVDTSANETKRISLLNMLTNFIDAVHIKTNAITSSKILNGAVTDDKWRNGVAFRARRNAAYNSPAGGSTSGFNFDTIVYNYGSAYNASTGLFTAPFDGIYSFKVSFFTETTATGRAFLVPRGTVPNEYKTRNFDGNAPSVNRVSGVYEFEMNTGETFGLDVWTSAVNNLGNPQETWFTGHLVTRL